jgi:hypothetical protein
MVDSNLLNLIARPQIANVPGQFAAGRQSALQSQLLSSQVEGQQQTNQSKAQQALAGISEQNLKNAFAGLALAANAPIEEQNTRIENIKPLFEGKPAFQQALTDLQNMGAEEKVQGFQKIGGLGQQLGHLEAPAQGQVQKVLKTVGNRAVVQQPDGTVTTIEVPGLDKVVDQDKDKALNIGSTVNLKDGKVGRVVTDPQTGATRVEVATIPEGAEVETPESISARKVRETQEKEEVKLLAKERATISKTIITDGRNADRDIIRLKRIKKGLQAFETGKLAQAKKIFGPFIPGIDPSDEQAMEALLQSAVFPVLAQFKGPTTDFEFEKANETIARLGNTPRANALIVDSMIQFMTDKKEERNQFKKFVRGKGKPEDFTFEPSIGDPFGQEDVTRVLKFDSQGNPIQ